MEITGLFFQPKSCICCKTKTYCGPNRPLSKKCTNSWPKRNINCDQQSLPQARHSLNIFLPKQAKFLEGKIIMTSPIWYWTFPDISHKRPFLPTGQCSGGAIS